MIGIDLEKMDNLLKKNELYYQSIKEDSVELRASITELVDCYGGKTIDSIFFKALSQVNTIKNIDNYLNSYFTLLKSVKNSYILQDARFGQQLNQTSQVKRKE